MSHVLHIDTSATLDGSRSRGASAAIVASLLPQTVTVRDLARDPLPQIDGAWVDARLVPAQHQGDDEKAALALSDSLIAELRAADTIVIGLPLYNFGLPAALKAWIDLVARPQVTFRYGSSGPEGLLTGKRAIVAFASGGVPMGSTADFATPHLHHVLRFLGFEDVTFLDAAEAEALAKPAVAATTAADIAQAA